MTCREWLSAPGMLARVSELVCVNGGTFNITSFGSVSSTDTNRYGRTGLAIEEAFELMYYKGAYDVLMASTDGPERNAVASLIRNEINGVKAGLIQICTEAELKDLLPKALSSIKRITALQKQ